MDMKSIPSLADRLKPKIKAWVAYVIWGTPITPGVQEELQINWRLHDAGGGYMCGGPREHPPPPQAGIGPSLPISPSLENTSPGRLEGERGWTGPSSAPLAPSQVECNSSAGVAGYFQQFDDQTCVADFTEWLGIVRNASGVCD